MKNGRFFYVDELKELLEIASVRDAVYEGNILQNAEKVSKEIALGLTKNQRKFNIKVGGEVFDSSNCMSETLAENIEAAVQRAREIIFTYDKDKVNKYFVMKLEQV